METIRPEEAARQYVFQRLAKDRPYISHHLAWHYRMNSEDGLDRMLNYLHHQPANLDHGGSVFCDFLQCAPDNFAAITTTLLDKMLLPDEGVPTCGSVRVMLVLGMLRYVLTIDSDKINRDMIEFVDSQLIKVVMSPRGYLFNHKFRTRDEATRLVQKEVKDYAFKFMTSHAAWPMSLMRRIAVGLNEWEMRRRLEKEHLDCLPAAIVDGLAYNHYLYLNLADRLLHQVPLVCYQFRHGGQRGQVWHYSLQEAQAFVTACFEGEVVEFIPGFVPKAGTLLL
jgi:hypothetical protein